MGRERPPGPLRTCVGCRRRAPAALLVRIARRPDGSLVVDRTAPGRGAWLCALPAGDVPVADCLEWADRRQAFNKAFRMAVGTGAAEALRATLRERARMESATPLVRN